MTRFTEGSDLHTQKGQEHIIDLDHLWRDVQHCTGQTITSVVKTVEDHPYITATAVCALGVVARNPKVLAGTAELAELTTLKTTVFVDDTIVACQRKLTIPMTLVGRSDRFECVYPAASDFSQAFIKARQSVARVVSKGTNEEGLDVISSGTAFSVSRNGHFLTNYHVVAERNGLQLIDRFGHAHSASVVGADTVNDLAVLKLERAMSRHMFRPLRFGESLAPGCSLTRSDEAFSFGYPGTKKLTGSVKAHIPISPEALASHADNGRCLVPIHSRPGSSGSPLMDRYAQVIGVVRSSPTRQSPYFAARAGVIPSDAAQVLVDKIRWGNPF